MNSDTEAVRVTGPDAPKTNGIHKRPNRNGSLHPNGRARATSVCSSHSNDSYDQSPSYPPNGLTNGGILSHDHLRPEFQHRRHSHRAEKLGEHNDEATGPRSHTYAQIRSWADDPKTAKFPRISKPLELMRHSYDCVVIGSGYGGGVAASRMARTGESVCVLERGQERWPGEYPVSSKDALEQTHFSGQFDSGWFPKTALDGGNPTGMFHLIFGEGQNAVVCNGLGGTSLMNANVFLEADEDALRLERWPKEIKEHPECLKKYYEKVEKVLEPRSYPEDWPKLPKLELLKKQAQYLNMDEKFRRVRQTTRFHNGPNSVGVEMSASASTGQDFTGLNDGSKTTTLVTYLADAWNWGADMFCESEVRYITEAPEREGYIIYFAWHGRNRGHFKSRLHGDLMWIHARKAVFLGAGAIATTEILLRSREMGLKMSSTVGKNMSGNGDMFAFGYNTNHEVNSIGRSFPSPYNPIGPCITGIIDNRKGHDNPEDGYVIEEGTIPGALAPFMQALLELLPGDIQPKDQTLVGRFKANLARAGSFFLGPYYRKGAVRRTQVFLIMSHDSNQAFLTLKDDKPILEFIGVGRSDHVKELNNVLEKATRAVGGTYVKSPFDTLMNNNQVTVHPIGGACMADSGSMGVTNHEGKVFTGEGKGVHDGLIVTDAAVIPTALGANPFATIAALAERSVEAYCRDAGLTIRDDKNAVLDLFGSPQHPHYHSHKPRSAQRTDEREENDKISSTHNSMDLARRHKDGGFGFSEVMSGYIHPGRGYSRDDPDTYELAARIAQSQCEAARFYLSIHSFNTRSIVHDPDHSATLTGTFVCPTLPGSPFMVQRGDFKLFLVDHKAPGTRNLTYDFDMRGVNGKRYHFHGYKVVDSSVAMSLFHFWKSTSTLYVTITEYMTEHHREAANADEEGLLGNIVAKGIMRITPRDFISELLTLAPTGSGSLRKLASAVKFMTFFTRKSLSLFLAPLTALQYPTHTYAGFLNDTVPTHSYKIEARDGVITSMHMWESTNPDIPTRNLFMIPGASVDHQIFALPTIRYHAVNYFRRAGYRVFITVHRIGALMVAQNDWTTFDARLDIKRCLEVIREEFPDYEASDDKGKGKDGGANDEPREPAKIYTIAHCMGSVALSTGLLDGTIPGSWVKGLTCSQVFMNPIWNTMNMIKALALPIPADTLYRTIAGSWFSCSTSKNDSFIQKGINELLRFMPDARREICNNASCHRTTLVFGRCWNHHNLNEATHRQIDRFFGGVNMTLLHLLMKQGSHGGVMSNGPLFERLDTRENIMRLKGIPILLFVGRDNAVLSPESTERTYEALTDAFGTRLDDGIQYRRRVVPDYGHLDCWMGRNAWRDVYPFVREEVDRVVRGPEYRFKQPHDAFWKMVQKGELLARATKTPEGGKRPRIIKRKMDLPTVKEDRPGSSPSMSSGRQTTTTTSKKRKRQPAKPRSRLSNDVSGKPGKVWYTVRNIVDEKTRGGKVTHYLIDWEGNDEEGKPFKPTWEPAHNVNELAVRDWESKKSSASNTAEGPVVTRVWKETAEGVKDSAPKKSHQIIIKLPQPPGFVRSDFEAIAPSTSGSSSQVFSHESSEGSEQQHSDSAGADQSRTAQIQSSKLGDRDQRVIPDSQEVSGTSASGATISSDHRGNGESQRSVVAATQSQAHASSRASFQSASEAPSRQRDPQSLGCSEGWQVHILSSQAGPFSARASNRYSQQPQDTSYVETSQGEPGLWRGEQVPLFETQASGAFELGLSATQPQSLHSFSKTSETSHNENPESLRNYYLSFVNTVPSSPSNSQAAQIVQPLAAASAEISNQSPIDFAIDREGSEVAPSFQTQLQFHSQGSSQAPSELDGNTRNSSSASRAHDFDSQIGSSARVLLLNASGERLNNARDQTPGPAQLTAHSLNSSKSPPLTPRNMDNTQSREGTPMSTKEKLRLIRERTFAKARAELVKPANLQEPVVPPGQSIQDPVPDPSIEVAQSLQVESPVVPVADVPAPVVSPTFAANVLDPEIQHDQQQESQVAADLALELDVVETPAAPDQPSTDAMVLGDAASSALATYNGSLEEQPATLNPLALTLSIEEEVDISPSVPTDDGLGTSLPIPIISGPQVVYEDDGDDMMLQVDAEEDDAPSDYPASLLPFVPTGVNEYLVTVPIHNTVRTLYNDIIRDNEQVIHEYNAFFRVSPYQTPDRGTILRLDKLFSRLFDICDYPLFPDTVMSMSPEAMTKHTIETNGKFAFVAEFLDRLSDFQSEAVILILARPGRLLDLLGHLVETRGYCYIRSGKETIQPRATPRHKLTVAISSTADDLAHIEKDVDAVIAFDYTFRQELVPPRTDLRSPVLMALASTASVQHLNMRIKENLEPLERKNVLMLTLVKAMRYVEDHTPIEPVEPYRAAARFARHVHMPDDDDFYWHPHELAKDIFEDLYAASSQTQLSVTEQLPGSRKRSHAGDDDELLSKRQKLSQPKVLESISHVSDSLKSLLGDDLSQDSRKSTVILPAAKLEELAEKVARLEAELWQTKEREHQFRKLSDRSNKETNAYVASVNRIQERFMEALKDRGIYEAECKSARAEAKALSDSLESGRKSSLALKERNEDLQKKLAHANEMLLSSENPDLRGMAQLEKDREEAQAKIEQMEKTAAVVKGDLEYAQTMYSQASTKVVELRAENNKHLAQIEALARKADDNVVEVNRIQRAGEVAELLRMLNEQKVIVRERETELARVRDELRSIRSGRRETRQTSVPRSPRLSALGIMSPRNGGGRAASAMAGGAGAGSSRGTSPAAAAAMGVFDAGGSAGGSGGGGGGGGATSANNRYAHLRF